MKMQQYNPKTAVRDAREFGLVVGLAFTLLGCWWLYRNNSKQATNVFFGLGAGLIFFGLVFPRALVWPNRAWMQLARVMSMVTTPVILGIIYFLIFMPVGMIKRQMGWDPLRRRGAPAQSYWVAYNPRQHDPRHFEKMY